MKQSQETTGKRSAEEMGVDVDAEGDGSVNTKCVKLAGLVDQSCKAQ